jgi:hypothetical protein
MLVSGFLGGDKRCKRCDGVALVLCSDVERDE